MRVNLKERNQLSRNEVEHEEKIVVLNHLIADEEATKNRNIIMDNFKDLSENPENVNLQHMWKVCKKLWLKLGPTLPTAKRNHMGKIVTGPRDIKNFETHYRSER